MVIFDFLNNLVPTNWKSVKNWFIHNFFNKIKTILDLKCLLYWSHLNIFSLLKIFCWFTKVGFRKKMSLIMFKWPLPIYFLVIFNITFKYRIFTTQITLYGLSPVCVSSGDLQANFSVKTFHHTGYIYRASPQVLYILWWFTKVSLR